MTLLLLLLSVSCSMAQTNISIVCDGMVFNDKYYDRQVLFEEFGRSYNLVQHEATNQLFFSHAFNNDTNSYRRFMVCEIETKMCKKIEGASGKAIFYYEPKDEMYFGGYKGIFQYNFKTKKAQVFAEKGSPIWCLLISDGKFYYTSYWEKTLLVDVNGTFEKVPEMSKVEIDNFFITKHFVLYFTNVTGLYKTEQPSFYSAVLLDDKVFVRQITGDVTGKVYVCARDGIYLDDVLHGVLKKVADIDGAFSIHFASSGGSILYSDENGIYKLSPSKNIGHCSNSTDSGKR